MDVLPDYGVSRNKSQLSFIKTFTSEHR